MCRLRNRSKMPVINISIDRQKLALMNLTIDNVSKSITDATSSSRFTNKNLWLDDKTSYTYQTQIFIPEYIMNSTEQLKSIPLVQGQMRPVLADVATLSFDTIPGEYDRSGPRRFVTVSANINKKDLGSATTAVQKAIDELGTPPTGLVPEIKGMSSLLIETLVHCKAVCSPQSLLFYYCSRQIINRSGFPFRCWQQFRRFCPVQ